MEFCNTYLQYSTYFLISHKYKLIKKLIVTEAHNTSDARQISGDNLADFI